MRTPLQYINTEPFPLRWNVSFLYLRYVSHGLPQWKTPVGERVGLFGVGSLPEIHFQRDSPLAWATWEKDRLEAPEEAEFTT
jgi:hypothetical protein